MADKRTNDQIDSINKMRETLGEEKLPYETDEAGAGGEADEAEKKKQANIAAGLNEDGSPKTTELTDEVKKANIAKGLNEDGSPKTTTTITDEQKKENLAKGLNEDGTPKAAEIPAIDDAAVLAYLKSKHGKEVSSLDEILNPKKEPTKEDKEKEAQQREGNKIAYALQNGKFSDKELKDFISDSKNPHDLVFAQYAAEQKAADKDLTDDEIEAEFKEKYGLDQENTSRKYKRGQTELDLLADNILKQRHSKIINFDSEYTGIETQQLTEKQTQQKILSQAPVYKKDVEDVYEELKKITVSFGGNNYEIEVPQEILDAQKVSELEDTYAASEIKNGWTKEAKKNTAKTALIIANLPLFMQSAAEQYHKGKAAGSHGIPPVGEKEKPDEQAVSERKKKLMEHHGSYITETATN